MLYQLFVDGICEIDDEAIKSYFLRFGSRITDYECHRQRPTNSCCFAIISFTSQHTVNDILCQRPHSINFYRIFVKRLLPPETCSFIERLLPVSSIFVYDKVNKEIDKDHLRTYFEDFGNIVKFERDHIHNRFLIEYDDYDSVDKLFLKKEFLPYNINIRKNTLPRAQNTVQYHGICRLKRRSIIIDEKAKRYLNKKRNSVDNEYQDLLQKITEDLINCKAQLKSKENDYIILQMEYNIMREKNEKLNQLLHNQIKAIDLNLLCEEHQITIDRSEQPLIKLNEKFNTMNLEYQRLLSQQNTPRALLNSKLDISTQPRRHVLSNRLNNNRNFKNEVPENSLSQYNQSIPHYCNIDDSPSALIQSHIQQNRTKYNYSCRKTDEA